MSRSVLVAAIVGTLTVAAALVPDANAMARFPTALSENTTDAPTSTLTGPPDDDSVGLGRLHRVTYDFGAGVVLLNFPGPDFNVYEQDSGTAEFDLIDVLISSNGLDFTSVKASEAAGLDLAGDGDHSLGFVGSYDFGLLDSPRYIRIQGIGESTADLNNGFDLDAIGAALAIDTVPEPTSLVLFAVGMASMTVSRLRRRK